MFGEGPAHAHCPGFQDQSKTSLESSATLSYAPGQVVHELAGSQESIMPNHPEPFSGNPGAAEHHTEEEPDVRRNRIYPLPDATHELVCQHASIFERTLKKVYWTLGISDDKVPRIGGRDLDLHLLYKMVTTFGGCQEVIRKKLWKEVSEPFNLPPTITSVSFVLRKAYITYLWDYEQIYCFRRVGKMVPPPERQRQSNHKRSSAKQKLSGLLPVRDASQERMDEDDDKENKSNEAKPARSSEGDAQSSRKKKKIDDFEDYIPNNLVMASSEDEDPHSISTGTTGRISVDGKFGMGYFVSTCIGDQNFKGVLYCQPAKGDTKARKKAATGEQGMDIQQPRSHRSPFKSFMGEAKPRLKQSYPYLSQEGITQKLWDMWPTLPPARPDPFIKLSTRDKQRYHLEMEAYSHRIMAEGASAQIEQSAESVRQLQKTLVESQVPNILQPQPNHTLEAVHHRLRGSCSSSKKPHQESLSASMGIGMASFLDPEHCSEGPPSGSLGYYPPLPSPPIGLGFEASNQALSTTPAALGNTVLSTIPAPQAFGYQLTNSEGWLPHVLPQQPTYTSLSNFGPVHGVPNFSVSPPNGQF